MLNSKDRARLMKASHDAPVVCQVGKAGVTPSVTESVIEAVEARELIKIGVLDSCEESAREIAEVLAGRARAEVVRVIGRKIVLYKEYKDKRRSK
ncbi:MAG: YhbY family RNA-binding protein [Clostridiales bacterium]|jgi:RNA-binding protein|nr:YhbY family RNA-binding protein [Clostridiales bacterium]